MLKLSEWRESAIDTVVETLCAEDGEAGEFALVWYSTLDDWMRLDGREPIMWRPHCAMAADTVALGARLVQFDSVKYVQWLGKREDSEARAVGNGDCWRVYALYSPLVPHPGAEEILSIGVQGGIYSGMQRLDLNQILAHR